MLHGAYSAGLVSRMAGMHIPGRDCLLHGMHLRFLQPVVPPVRLQVRGALVAERGDSGKVSVTVTDADTGRRYVEASYEFGRHGAAVTAPARATAPAPAASGEPVILVTGATGGIGGALLHRLGAASLGVSRRAAGGPLAGPGLQCVGGAPGDPPPPASVHCAWPLPGHTRPTPPRHP